MRLFALGVALFCAAVAAVLLTSLPSPACAEGGCPPWTCVDRPESCGDCECNMEFDVCEVPDGLDDR